MLLDTRDETSEVAPEHEDTKFVVETAANLNQDLDQAATETQSELAEAEADVLPDYTSEEDRRFWTEIEVIGRMNECSSNIRMAEEKIDDWKKEIKEEKEFLTGEEIRLKRLAMELSDIVTGKPLPIDRVKEAREKQKATAAKVAIAAGGDAIDDDWRKVPTADLVDGVEGMGAKKLDALVTLAPTAGDLEDLRGQSSKAHQSFKEVLPDGFGQTLADRLEDRLIECVARGAMSAAEQAEEEREAHAADDEEQSEAEDDGPRLADVDADEYEDAELSEASL